MKTPEHYRAPLRSRSAIIAWLVDRANSNRRPSYGLFCYDVKLGRLNTDFSHAVKLARESGCLPCDSARFLAECEALWDAGRMETAFEVGTEDACESVVSDDTNRMLWDGAGPIAEWEFNGRSGGWLCLKEFDGVDFAKAAKAWYWSMRGTFEQLCKEASYSWLRNLYRFLIQCDHDFRRPESEVEYLAASWFFANAVSGIKTDAEIEAEQAAELAESTERAHWEARDSVTV